MANRTVAIVVVLGIFTPALARAALMIDITGPPRIVVEEGESGLVDFVIKNTGTVNATIDALKKPLVGDIIFVRGDGNDEVFRTTLLDPNNCVGMVLQPGQLCLFQQSFDTRDLNKPMSGQNEGAWGIVNRVEFHETTNPANADINLGSTIVHVRDPLFVPEPPSGILCATGALSLIAFRVAKSRRAE